MWQSVVFILTHVQYFPNKMAKIIKSTQIGLAWVGCELFLELNFPDIFFLCERNLEESIDPTNFSWRDYLSSIQNDSVAVYVK